MPDIVGADLDRVVLHAERIEIRLAHEATNDGEASPKFFSIPWTKPSSVRRREVILPTQAEGGIAVRPIRTEEQARLLKAIAMARRWLDELIAEPWRDLSINARRILNTLICHHFRCYQKENGELHVHIGDGGQAVIGNAKAPGCGRDVPSPA